MLKSFKYILANSAARRFSSLQAACQKTNPPATAVEENYTTIYRFPYIKTLVLANRLKVYQTIFTATAIPTSIILNQLNYANLESVLVTTSLGLSGCLTLYTLGYLLYNFVGFVYVNEDCTKVKVAYVNFWGKRQDIEMDVKDVVPFTEQEVSVTDGLFLKLQRFSSDDYLKINLKFGEILDNENFTKIFSTSPY